VETLQFANAKIRNVSQNNNNNKTGETTAEKIVNIYSINCLSFKMKFRSFFKDYQCST